MRTPRTGGASRASVTDWDGRSLTYPTLFLAGAGLSPTTGTANPTTTVAARSLRTVATIEAGFGLPASPPAASPVDATPGAPPG